MSLFCGYRIKIKETRKSNIWVCHSRHRVQSCCNICRIYTYPILNGIGVGVESRCGHYDRGSSIVEEELYSIDSIGVECYNTDIEFGVEDLMGNKIPSGHSLRFGSRRIWRIEKNGEVLGVHDSIVIEIPIA